MSGKSRRGLNLSPRGQTYPMGEAPSGSRHLSAESNQDEIDQGNQGRADAGGDQGVIGAEVSLRIER
jgi:hypothetical protein